MQIIERKFLVGQKTHKANKYRQANGFSLLKEHKLPSGQRIDFLDRERGVIYELKPNNPRAIKRGNAQLVRCKKEMESHPFYKDTKWETKLETY